MQYSWQGTPNYTKGNQGRFFLFPHWTAGSFDGSLSTLKNPAVQASAHYLIEGDRVAQLVNDNDSAWHCGNSYYNMRSISYEMVGWPGNPPSRATLDMTAQLMANASKAYMGGAPLVLGGNVLLHKMVYATSCPGESDIGYLVQKANDLLNPAPPAPANPPVILWPGSSKPSQRWATVAAGDLKVDGKQAYRLMHATSGKCLAPALLNGQLEPGAGLVLEDANTWDYQAWVMDEYKWEGAANTFAIKNATRPDLVIAFASAESGQQGVVWARNDLPGQVIKTQYVGADQFTLEDVNSGQLLVPNMPD